MHRAPQISVLRAVSLLGAVVAVGCASAGPDAGSGERLGSEGERVDLAASPSQVTVAQDGSRPSKATGAVFVPYLDGNHAPTYVASSQYGNLPVRGTCGITFVSPHFAMTSSHCFADTNAYAPASQTFTAMTFDVTQANPDEFYFDSAMQGTFPNYTPIFGHTMNQTVGYTSTAFTCRIASRCAGPTASNYNCDGVFAPDVTMLECDSRPGQGAWLPIASDASTSGDVYMYWFHELFWTNNNADMITHYTNDSGYAANWHYLAAPTNVFLPFMSVPWASGAQRGRFGGGGDNDVKTDLYGCHGTSGSGVLSKDGSGNYALLGTVHNGSSWAVSHLCDDPSALSPGAPGGHGLTYNANTSLNNLVKAKYASALQNDRVPPPVCGDGVCNGRETHASCPEDCGCRPGTIDCCGDGTCLSLALCRKINCE
jgi:hypothetical protein